MAVGQYPVPLVTKLVLVEMLIYHDLPIFGMIDIGPPLGQYGWPTSAMAGAGLKFAAAAMDRDGSKWPRHPANWKQFFIGAPMFSGLCTFNVCMN